MHALSFSGRVELIKSVIHGIISYWIQSFHFPVTIWNEVDRLCANFVWKGKMHTWAWDSLCRSKSGGGMGLRRAQGINNVAELKRFWNCCNSKSIWARWLKDHYLKGRSLWEIKAQPVDSYVWKNIIAARQTASAHMYLPRQC